MQQVVVIISTFFCTFFKIADPVDNAPGIIISHLLYVCKTRITRVIGGLIYMSISSSFLVNPPKQLSRFQIYAVFDIISYNTHAPGSIGTNLEFVGLIVTTLKAHSSEMACNRWLP